MNKYLKRVTNDRALATLVLSVIFSLAAGVVGALLVLANNPTGPLVIEAVTVPRAALSVTRIQANRLEATDSALRAAVLIFEDKGQSKSGNLMYVGSEAVGSGLILTSDGWVVTHESAVPNLDGLAYVALVGGSLYPVEDVVVDEYSGAVFFKVPAGNLSVAAFAGRGTEQEVGDQLFAFDSAGGVRNLTVVDVETAPVTGVKDLVWSSESLNRFLLCDSEFGLLPGSMVMNEKGEVIGVTADEESDDLFVVPSGEFVEVVDEVFRGRGAQRPYMGVNYLDLSEPAAMTDESLPRQGALLSASIDGKAPAIIKFSPAAEANLREGDIIVSVNGELISGRRTLSEVIATYFPGMNVTLGVQRRGVDISVNLTLGEKP